MRTLYESILDNDETVKERSKQAILDMLVDIIAKTLPDFAILSYPERKFIYGSCRYTYIRSLKFQLKELYNEIKKCKVFKIVSYNESMLQLHFKFDYDNERITVGFTYNNSEGPKLVMNLFTKTSKTVDVLKEIFDEKIPF